MDRPAAKALFAQFDKGDLSKRVVYGQKGGYDKYLKYKAKYLNLQNNLFS
jgi:hypothetical protein